MVEETIKTIKETENEADEIIRKADATCTEILEKAAREAKEIKEQAVANAKKQAEEYGHSLRREMCFLFTHGILHLLGYDHMTDEQEKEMFGLQDKILGALNIEREGV